VLFIDIVGYSKLLINEQRASLDNLGTNYSGTIAGKQIEEAIAKARASAKSALALDPNLAEAHLAQGIVLRDLDFNFLAAEAECRRALELEPQNSLVIASLASTMATLGRLDEAAALVQQAITLEPLRSSFHCNLAIYLTSLGRYDDAEASLHRERSRSSRRPA
jgi:Flp pilus assembly protein TadD